MFKYPIGTVIHHVRYDYRGVVIKADPECRAGESWYQRNRTQPQRDQPWYHILVHGGNETYVAEENLEPDTAAAPIEHPMIPRFFPTFFEGKYHSHSLN